PPHGVADDVERFHAHHASAVAYTSQDLRNAKVARHDALRPGAPAEVGPAVREPGARVGTTARRVAVVHRAPEHAEARGRTPRTRRAARRAGDARTPGTRGARASAPAPTPPRPAAPSAGAPPGGTSPRATGSPPGGRAPTRSRTGTACAPATSSAARGPNA